MKETIIRHFKSALVTFIGFFLFAFFGTIASEGFLFSKAAVIGAGIGAGVTAIRAVAKILVELGSYLIAFYKK